MRRRPNRQEAVLRCPCRASEGRRESRGALLGDKLWAGVLEFAREGVVEKRGNFDCFNNVFCELFTLFFASQWAARLRKRASKKRTRRRRRRAAGAAPLLLPRLLPTPMATPLPLRSGGSRERPSWYEGGTKQRKGRQETPSMVVVLTSTTAWFFLALRARPALHLFSLLLAATRRSGMRFSKPAADSEASNGERERKRWTSFCFVFSMLCCFFFPF